MKEYNDAYKTLCSEKEEKEKYDNVKEPPHYKQGRYEVIDEMLLLFGVKETLAFCKLNAWKYRSRALYKGSCEQDMAKADRYTEMYEQIIRKAYGNKSVCLIKDSKETKEDGSD